MEREPDDDETSGSSRGNGVSGDAGPGSAGGTPTFAGPIYSLRLKLLVVATVAVSVAVVSALALRTSGDGEPADGAASGGVVAVHPVEGSQALQQATVRVDLRPGWNGRLTVAGRPIPEGELRRSDDARLDPGETAGVEDRLEFVPGPDKVMGALPEGQVCAEVEVWRRSAGPEGGTDRVSWCFQVV